MVIRGSSGLVLGLVVSLLLGCSDNKSSVASAEPPANSAEALIAQGNQKSRMCMGCHGPKGVSRVASYPSLAGQAEDYLAEQLHAFRSGGRENPMMNSIVMSLDDDDIRALAAYYASQSSPTDVSAPDEPLPDEALEVE